jgi:hypothetical protein
MWRRAWPRISEFLQLVLITATLAAIAAAFAAAGILSRPWGAR